MDDCLVCRVHPAYQTYPSDCSADEGSLEHLRHDAGLAAGPNYWTQREIYLASTAC
jgi:hypothetical protein